MLSVHLGGVRFDLRAAAVIGVGGKVLLHRPVGTLFWSLPGGRVEPGESAAQAVVRELEEELGVRVMPGRLLWTIENFYDAGEGPVHEVGLYVEAELPPECRLMEGDGPFTGREGGAELEFAWHREQGLGELTILPRTVAGLLPVRPWVSGGYVERGA